jgi:hypothetical protein
MADRRFEKVRFDPKFKQVKKSKTKVDIDSRFSSVLDNEFDTVQIDKFGRKKIQENNLAKFYQLDADVARGKTIMESSEEEFSDAAESLEDLFEEEQIPLGDETNRLAVVNLDWDNVKAKDLFKAFQAFVPKQGVIKSCAIYLSEFGKERLENETVHGPPAQIFADDSLIGSDDGKEFNDDQLRKYQLDRLRYYYAVLETDSIETAKSIFTSCDGVEFESSGNFLDLRYIPADMEFTDQPSDVTNEEPLHYTPSDFITDALQHSKVKLTWDAQDPERTRFTQRQFSKKELEDMDFKAYLASDTDQSLSGKDEQDVEKYRALLNESDSQDENQEMEITFTPGITEKATKAIEEKKRLEILKDETVFEKYLRERKEKKLAKRKPKAQDTLEDSDSVPEAENDPFFRHEFDEKEIEEKPKKKKLKANNKKGHTETEDQKRDREDLELLLMEEKARDSKHFTVKDVLKAQKPKTKKKRKPETLEHQEGFELNLTDPRFADVLENHQMAIDPTNPQ